MTHDDERDGALDQLLRRSLAGTPEPTPTDACLDAGTLAAWVDGELGGAAVRAAEAHAARCARCQSILAVMVQPPDPVAASGTQPGTGLSGFRLSLRWLAPLTGGALAATLWLLVAPHMRAPGLPPATVSLERAEPRPPAALSSEAKEKDTAAAAAGKHAAAAELKDEARRRDATPQRASEERQQVADQARRKLAKAEADAAPVDKPLDVTTVAQSRQATGLPAEAAAALPAPRPVPEAPPPASARGGRAEAVAATPPVVGRLAFKAAAGPVVILSPDPASRWRITPPRVEHSTDGGTTWTTQILPEDVALVAGAAPSASVCWLVGRVGVVMLTTDARTWQRLPFPEGVDLVAVRASDDRTATVQAADGRSFRTVDGGRSWGH